MRTSETVDFYADGEYHSAAVLTGQDHRRGRATTQYYEEDTPRFWAGDAYGIGPRESAEGAAPGTPSAARSLHHSPRKKAGTP
jgi:hypothetical protein